MFASVGVGEVGGVVAVEVLLGPDLVAVPASSAAAGEDQIQNVAAVVDVGHEGLSWFVDVGRGVGSHTLGSVLFVVEGGISHVSTNLNFSLGRHLFFVYNLWTFLDLNTKTKVNLNY